MKRMILAAVAALALTGCTTGTLSSIPTNPSEVANHTLADEQALLRCQRGYKLSRSIGELGVDAGVIKGAAAVTASSLDTKLFAGLQVCKGAYAAFNSAGLIQAADNVDALGDQIDALIHGAK